MLRRWVLTTAGFSSSVASFLAARSFLSRAICFRLRPRRKRRRTRELNISKSWSLYQTQSLEQELNTEFIKTNLHRHVQQLVQIHPSEGEFA